MTKTTIKDNTEITLFCSDPFCHAQNTPVDWKTTNKRSTKTQSNTAGTFRQSNTNILQILRRNREAKVGENGIIWMYKKTTTDRDSRAQKYTKTATKTRLIPSTDPIWVDCWIYDATTSIWWHGVSSNPNPWPFQNEEFPTAKNAATPKNGEIE